MLLEEIYRLPIVVKIVLDESDEAWQVMAPAALFASIPHRLFPIYEASSASLVIDHTLGLRHVDNATCCVVFSDLLHVL